jgi:predicted nucleotide-binding protein
MAEQTTGSTPLLEVLRGYLDAEKNSLSYFARREPGGLYSWVTSVRTLLARIYGTDSECLAAFPAMSGLPQKAEVPAIFAQRAEQLRRIIADLEVLVANSVSPLRGRRVFIGHGRSPIWRELKDFIADRLQLPWDEFNREAVAGIATSERLATMLDQAAFAFLIMTAEEEHMDSTLHARPNVIHEVGLFQGRLGPRHAIVMVEEGCAEFSNITGLSQIRFPPGQISARFEDVRRVLEREKLI